jgi:hypothetical protein
MVVVELMFDKYENKITTVCGCGTEANVSVEAALKDAINGCADCGQKVTFTLPSVKPSDKKAK